MGVIDKRIREDGSHSYRVKIRRDGQCISKTFEFEEDAILYMKYKERLIANIVNFDVQIEERVTLEQIIEMKIKSLDKSKLTAISDLKTSFNLFSGIFSDKFFYLEITYDDWVTAAKTLINLDVYRGGKTECSKRKMSISTLRNHLSYMSSAVNYAISQGVQIDNHPLKVVQTYINKIKKEKNELNNKVTS